MAKGSQLSQLKSALSQAGLSRQSQPGDKKRKRTSGGDTSLDKEKKAKKLDEIQKKLNPFDVKVTKLKHDVGGRKVKGVTGRPGLSKQVGIEQVLPSNFSFLVAVLSKLCCQYSENGLSW
jgi:nucleolar protein 14